jgi:transcription factor SPN1
MVIQTLDALPAHLVTPFNGAMPPSNLLDKIARGVSQAKGTADWPHSIRATRVKLLELARVRAKEEALADQRRKVITEEDDVEIDGNYSYFGDSDMLHQTANIGIGKNGLGVGLGHRRPLHRQSSMDFMNTAATNLKDNDNINRYVSVVYTHPYPLASINALPFIRSMFNLTSDPP